MSKQVEAEQILAEYMQENIGDIKEGTLMHEAALFVINGALIGVNEIAEHPNTATGNAAVALKPYYQLIRRAFILMVAKQGA